MLLDKNGEKLLPDFTSDGESIQQKNSTKYLLVQIGNQLKCKDLISQVPCEVLRAVIMLRRVVFDSW